MYSPSPFGSPFNKGLPDLKSAKKKQSVIKTVTANFVKLMISWRQDVSQIDILLSNLQKLISNLESIQRIECRQPQAFPLFVKLFPDAYSLLTGKIYGEVEAVYHQLKSYITGLGDILMAMKMVEREVSALVKDECVEAFSMDGLDAIFTTDHLLSIQQLSCQYCMEYERKQDIIKCIISCKVSNLLRPLEVDSRGGSERSQTVKSSSSGSTPWISSDDIGEIVSIWADDSEESMIEIEEVEDFILANVRNGGSGAD